MSETDSTKFKAPHMAFATLLRFIEELAERPLPPVIDRSMMNSKSGTDQLNLFAALKTFGLIDETNKVTPALTALTAKEVDDRKDALRALIKRYYREAIEVGAANGTQAQLLECFRDRYGVAGVDTQRKAASFFLHAARFAGGIDLSPHFAQTRTGQGGPGKGKPRKKAAKKTSAKPADEVETPTTDQYDLAVELATGGTMRLTVNVNPLSLRGADRQFFYDIVDKLTDYQDEHPTTTPAGDDDDVDDDSPLDEPSPR